MTDTQWLDLSEFNDAITEQYNFPFVSFRVDDGNYMDKKFAGNMANSKKLLAEGKIVGFMTYFVYEPNWQETINDYMAAVGTPDPHMATMIDVESWAGRIKGDQSAQINAAREQLITWHGGDRKKVGGYGNGGDLASLWPTRGDSWIGYANYTENKPFPGKLFHQYMDNYSDPAFGPGGFDINSADGYTTDMLCQALGIPVPGTVIPPSPTQPAPVPPTPIVVDGRHQIATVVVHSGDTLSGIAHTFPEADVTYQTIAADNGIANPSSIFAGQVLRILSSSGSAPALGAPAPAGPRIVGTYTVRSGDNLTTIASHYPQAWATAASIEKVNGLSSSTIYPGQVLRIGG